jgi:hypothetical protein
MVKAASLAQIGVLLPAHPEKPFDPEQNAFYAIHITSSFNITLISF